ncbi:MAG TPA: ester cyclase [Vicinamibacterales bacterium]|nr:ester cyclase [Vicinamibacterales bacterium]
MRTDEIRSFLDHFRDSWTRQDVTSLAACYTDDCLVISPIFSRIRGRANLEKSFVDLFKAFHTTGITVEELVISPDEPRAVLLWKIQSTHVGEVFGMPPSGKPIERSIAFFLTLKNGLIEKETRVYDFTSMLMELGVLKVKPAN